MRLFLFLFAGLSLCLVSIYGIFFWDQISIPAFHFVPKFQVDDCIQSNEEFSEPWEKRSVVMKIRQIGHRAYRVNYSDHNGGFYPDDETEQFFYEDFYDKVPCP